MINNNLSYEIFKLYLFFNLEKKTITDYKKNIKCIKTLYKLLNINDHCYFIIDSKYYHRERKSFLKKFIEINHCTELNDLLNKKIILKKIRCLYQTYNYYKKYITRLYFINIDDINKLYKTFCCNIIDKVFMKEYKSISKNIVSIDIEEINFNKSKKNLLNLEKLFNVNIISNIDLSETKNPKKNKISIEKMSSLKI